MEKALKLSLAFLGMSCMEHNIFCKDQAMLDLDHANNLLTIMAFVISYKCFDERNISPALSVKSFRILKSGVDWRLFAHLIESVRDIGRPFEK